MIKVTCSSILTLHGTVTQKTNSSIFAVKKKDSDVANLLKINSNVAGEWLVPLIQTRKLPGLKIAQYE
jgi:hypothetical protein